MGRQTLRRLAKHARSRNERDALAAVLGHSERRGEPDEGMKREKALLGASGTLSACDRHFQLIRLEQEGWDVIRPGLKKIYRQCRSRMTRALETGADPDFHEWRIRVKNLFHILRLSGFQASKLTGQMEARLDKLQDKLGTSHDLAVLAAALQAEPDRYGGADTTRRVISLCEKRSRKLKRALARLGRRLFSEKPGRFLHELEQCWQKQRR